MPIKKELIYPTLLECCHYTENDDFWKYVFEDLAYGKAPYGTYVSHDYLCCKTKDREFSYKIDNSKDPKVLYDEIYNILFNKANIFSKLDLELKKQYFRSVENNIQEIRSSSWSAIKKKNIKESLIEDFVLDMKTKNNLTIIQSRRLLSFILLGIIFKLITSRDIKYNNGHIENIEGISFKPKKIIITRKVEDITLPTISECTTSPKKSLVTAWEKYIENIKRS